MTTTHDPYLLRPVPLATRMRRKRYRPVIRAVALRLALAPVTALGLFLTLYTSASPYPQGLALKHLVARWDCRAAAAVGLAPAPRGAPGYHARTDSDGNGVSCDPAQLLADAPLPAPAGTPLHAALGPARPGGARAGG